MQTLFLSREFHNARMTVRMWAAWHTDMPYWSFDSLHATSMWLALDDATYENGCMYFLPGTHRVLEQVCMFASATECVSSCDNLPSLICVII